VETGHKIFFLFLVTLCLAAIAALGLHGLAYYATPTELRHFLPDHDQMKASGNYSHGLGIIGTSLVVVGVATYSGRKRIRLFHSMGKISAWLQFHIALCLLGPILVIFHTTFKAGGVAAISLWTMVSVWVSGMIGRFLYTLIPRNLQGAELSTEQIDAELKSMSSALEESPTGRDLVRTIDQRFATIIHPSTLWQTADALFQLAMVRRELHRTIQNLIRRAGIHKQAASRLQRSADQRMALMQKMFVLAQVAKLFHYWHAIHLPFTVIMFITLAAHVTVTILVGYTWIF
jgi:hypothetical protein